MHILCHTEHAAKVIAVDFGLRWEPLTERLHVNERCSGLGNLIGLTTTALLVLWPIPVWSDGRFLRMGVTGR